MPIELRPSGISVVGDAPWGTHFCHFYETKQDLLDTLVPYFKVGLESKEFCLWVVSTPELITVEEAKGALAQVVPDLDRHLAAGNIEILNGLEWYLEENVFNLERVASAWEAKLKRALALGYDGMRVSGDTFWLRETDWKDFCAYEKQLNDSISDQRMTVLCTYPLAKSGAAEVLDVAKTHQFATARRQGEWEVIETTELIHAKAEIKRLDEALQRVIKRTPRPSAILKYGVPVLSVLAALIIALWMESALRSAPHVSLFLCAVMLSAWFGGVRPGLLAITLSLLAFAYILPPNDSLNVETREIPRLLLFALSALFVGGLSAAQRSKAESLRQARDVLNGTVQEQNRTNQALRMRSAERRHAEALLHAKEQQFQAIVENAPDQIIRYDREYRRTYVNPAVAQFYGVPVEALIGQPLGSDIPKDGLAVKEDELAKVSQGIAAVFDTGKTYDYELTWTMPKGRTYFSIRLFPEVDLNGSVVNVLGISRDITERKQAEEALDERLRFETLLTELSAAFANLSANGVDREIDKWLQTLAEFLGVDRASFLQFEEDWTTLYRTHSYTVPGIEPLPPPPIVLKDQFPWITDQLRRGVTVKWSRIPDDMAEEAVKEKEYAARLGVKSGLNIPVRVGGSVIGAITFTSITTYRDWPDAMVARLRLVGDIFAAAVERKRAEAALRKSEERFRQIAENLQDVIWMVDSKVERLLYVNPAYEKIWGASSASIYQDIRAFMESVHPDDREIVVRMIEEQKEAKLVTAEYRIIRPDGAIHWIRDRSFPVRNDEGEVYRIAGVSEDITEGKQAEERLRQSETQLAEAQRLAKVGSWNWDIKTNIHTWSDELYHMYGLHPQESEPSYDTFIELVHPDDRAAIDAAIERALNAQEPINSYLRITRPDGAERILHSRGTTIRDISGTPIRMYGTVQDVTERKQGEEAQRKAEQKYRDIFENAGEGIFQSTPDGRFIVANPALARMHGFASPEELIHSRLDISRQIYVDPTHREEFKHQIEEKGAVREFEHEVFRKDGSKFWISVNAHAVRDEQGEIQYYEGTAQDINERKAAEEQLKASSEQLRALSAALQSAREEEATRIAREIHDELGSALTSLKLDLELIRRDGFPQTSDADLSRVREKIKSMIQLIDQTVSMVRRISSELRPSILDDIGLVAAIRWQAQQFEVQSGIVCHYDFSLEDVDLDQQQSTAIFRVFQEALTNIIRHAEATRIDITLEKEDDDVVLTITDNGRGITTDEKSDRRSLGLLGMQERVSLIGGSIHVTGVDGKGTVITVRVPLPGRA